MNLQILFWILSLQLGSLLGLESGPSQEHESISVANGEQLVSYRPSAEPRIYRKETRHSHRDPSNTWSLQDLLRPSGLTIYDGPSSGPTGPRGSTGGGGSGAAGFGPGFGTGFGTSSHENVHSDSRETSAEYEHSSEKKNCIECPFPFVEVGNNCYFSPNCTSSPTLSWPAARLYCQGQLGVASDLAVFNDTNQYIDALNYIRFRDPKSLCSYWIGGSNVNGTFQWITGGYVPLGTPLWGFTSSGTQNPTNIGTNIYAFLSNADFYRVGNVAASATSIPLCQYVASCKSNRGANSGTTSGSGSTSTGGSGSGSVVNTVVNQEGSSYHSLQNITFVNEPLINVTSDFNSTAPSPLNITVFPPEITYYYYDADKGPHQCQYQTKGNCVPTPPYNYNPGSLPPTYNGGNNFNWETFRQGYNIPAMGSYVTTRESNVPTGSNVPFSGSYVTTREYNVPMGSNVPNVGYNAPVTGQIDSAQLAQPQQHHEISYHPLYARILNTMKTLMDKIESNSHQSEEGPVNSAVEVLAKNSISP